jgi:hypothetical protein
MIMEWDEITAENKASRRVRTDYICFTRPQGAFSNSAMLALETQQVWRKASWRVLG